MRRIALITPLLPVPRDPTRGRFLYETARALSRIASVRVFLQHPHYLSVRALLPQRLAFADVGGNFHVEDLDVETIEYPALPIVSRALNGWVSGAKLLPRLRAYAPDIVLAYWVYPDGFGAQRAARKLGVPCVIGALGTDIHGRQGLSKVLTRRTIRRSTHLIAVSDAMRAYAIDTYGARPEAVRTIVNGFNASVFGPRDPVQARKELEIAPGSRLIVYVGRLVETKGLRELLEAFDALRMRIADARLALIGEGPLREELAAAIAARGLKGSVVLPGGQPPEKVAQWIGAADLLTLPSWSEGYPNVVVEALACGRPVVGTRVGGMPELINESNGILVAPRDPLALADALGQALARRWDARAIAAPMQRSWDDVARETLQTCEHALAAAGR
jgi:glycosyltransferase involved in cell wall biosynthesis